MALAVADKVYLAVGGGLMTDPPLFGVVDLIDGDEPDVVRVCWENGAQSTFFSTDEDDNRLVKFTDLEVPLDDPHTPTLRRLSTPDGVVALTRVGEFFALVPEE